LELRLEDSAVSRPYGEPFRLGINMAKSGKSVPGRNDRAIWVGADLVTFGTGILVCQHAPH
jgi:hypothetical protein